ncbi:META domain-containing protein [Aliiroseovarius sp. F20344]|uniref:META domain-containing protein n=1 Tax=Aliiroseovarius sp. F20344 TaxID=2926414 RepID=UPI001FF593A6|nr:META domain-containing protein [Aliiroseovarius sp. F20344]MCK0140928.1 META domain-containing protein [Aliiroseovarius sp. F20344]
MRLLLFIAATATLMGCKDETISGYADADAEWRLVELDGDTFPARATITFPEKGRIAGKAPCNSFSTAQKAPYPWFETGPIASTKMACSDLEAESAFFEALSQMQISEVSGNTLILSSEAGSEMVFTSALP